MHIPRNSGCNSNFINAYLNFLYLKQSKALVPLYIFPLSL